MKQIVIWSLILGLLISLTGCGVTEPLQETTDTTGGSVDSAPVDVDFCQTDKDLFTDRDLAGTYENAVDVTLSGGGFTITQEGIYRFTGSLTEGGITVDVADDNAKVQIVLDGVHIACEGGAAICILNCDKVFVTLAAGSENHLSASGLPVEMAGYEIDAAIYSRSDLTVNGTGVLTVESPAGHGISSKDDLAITGGTINVTCAHQGLDANDSVRICNGNITVDSGKDGIHAENTDDTTLGFVYLSGGRIQIESEGDGISAGGWMQINDGVVSVLAGGGYENGEAHASDGWGNMGGRPGDRPRSGGTSTEDSGSMKGLKASGGMVIYDGVFDLDTADDAIHSDASVTVNGGVFHIASGDDGIHAEAKLTVTACTMEITQAYEGLEAEEIEVRGGAITMKCSDDGLNASGGNDSSGTEGGRDGMFGGGRPGNGAMGGGFGGQAVGSIVISGGMLSIYSGGDGLDSNGDLTISGGYTYVTNYTSGDVSVLDSQNRPVITGGTYIGLGISTMMAESFSTESAQGVIACTIGNQAAGTRITVTDSDGEPVIDVTTEYSTVLMIVSCPDLIKGQTYTVTAGMVSGELEAS